MYFTFVYLRWFAPFVMQWLNENDDVSLEFLRNAYAKDKKDNVSISQGNEAQNSDYIIRLII